jgi:hypothetical protein
MEKIPGANGSTTGHEHPRVDFLIPFLPVDCAFKLLKDLNAEFAEQERRGRG